MAASAPKRGKKFVIRIKTPVGRISYPHIAQADEGRPNSDGKFHFDLIFDKETWTTDPDAKDLRAAVLAVARETFGNPRLKFGEFKSPFKDGNTKPGAEYADCTFITPKSKYKPKVIGPNKLLWDDTRIAAIKGGDYARAIVSVFYYDNKGGGITCGLEMIQFHREGEALGRSVQALIDSLDELEVPLDDVSAEEAGEVEAAEDDDDDDATAAYTFAPPAGATPAANGAGAYATDAEDEDDDYAGEDGQSLKI